MLCPGVPPFAGCSLALASIVVPSLSTFVDFVADKKVDFPDLEALLKSHNPVQMISSEFDRFGGRLLEELAHIKARGIRSGAEESAADFPLSPAIWESVIGTMSTTLRNAVDEKLTRIATFSSKRTAKRKKPVA